MTNHSYTEAMAARLRDQARTVVADLRRMADQAEWEAQRFADSDMSAKEGSTLADRLISIVHNGTNNLDLSQLPSLVYNLASAEALVAKTRPASHDVHDGTQQGVCVACHRLPRFCRCAPGAVATCPICGEPEASGQHFPATDCASRRKKM